MVYLQQDAFDQVDASAPLPRQKRTFDLVFDLVNRPYQFKDKAAIRDYFVRLTGLFKNLNYSQEETAQCKEFLGKIQELADSTVLERQVRAPGSGGASPCRACGPPRRSGSTELAEVLALTNFELSRPMI